MRKLQILSKTSSEELQGKIFDLKAPRICHQKALEALVCPKTRYIQKVEAEALPNATSMKQVKTVYQQSLES